MVSNLTQLRSNAVVQDVYERQQECRNHQRCRLPRSCRSRPITHCDRSRAECTYYAIGWTQFYFARIDGKWNEWPTISICRLPACEKSGKRKTYSSIGIRIGEK